ncbi:MAG: hypothetical protein PVI30_21800 [Myxococcales bacterium]|jgi:hypothetical protein
MSRSVVVGYHGHCFDGMCSAAVATRLISAREQGALCFAYRGLDHQPGGSHVPEGVLAGELNAVVDFRYTTSPRLTWYFDHHVSGLGSDAERAHFEADDSGKKFFDPQYGSCCKLIADVALERFGLELPELSETVAWADVIDAARFESAAVAVELREPALQLMTVIEAHGDDAFLVPRIERLAGGASLAELAAERDVQALFAPLHDEHRRNYDAIAAGARCEGGVVYFDLVGSGRDRYNKFIPYELFPESRYCVAVTASAARSKVSVGSNPWAPVPRSHDIARICERYGGGGHPVVGAVSLAPDAEDRAREIAREIRTTLATG